MGWAYSVDLREKVVGAFDVGDMIDEQGWDKIRTLTGVRTAIQASSSRALLLTGDFNEPQYFPGILPVRSFAWTEDGHWERNRYKAWTRRNKRGSSEARPREEWDEAVRWFFDEASGLRHAYWACHGIGAMEPTHILKNGKPPERWFDHVFVAGQVEVRQSKYLHELRKPEGPSDHSGFWAQLAI